MKLHGKVAIVTGAGATGPGWGIGRAISVALARVGAEVMLVDLVEERARQTLDIIEREGGHGTVFVADLSDAAAAEAIAASTTSVYGKVDILVNNAAVSGAGDILESTREAYEQTIAVNLTAPYMMCKAVIPIMIKEGGGSIVNITSIVGMRGAAGQPAYAAAKAGLAGLTRDLAATFGRRGIRINCVAPGLIRTPTRQATIEHAGLGTTDLSDRTAVGFEGEAFDVARAVLFLVDPDARFITGVELPVDGGVTMRC